MVQGISSAQSRNFQLLWKMNIHQHCIKILILSPSHLNSVHITKIHFNYDQFYCEPSTRFSLSVPSKIYKQNCSCISCFFFTCPVPFILLDLNTQAKTVKHFILLLHFIPQEKIMSLTCCLQMSSPTFVR
jgi:hypothetical protein